MRTGLLAASLALLGSGAFAATSAIAIQDAASVTPVAAPHGAHRAVRVVNWDSRDEVRRLTLR